MLDPRPVVRPVSVHVEIVALGASAGGLEALHAVVAALPSDFPAAVVIVQHMDPRRRSHLADLLRRHSHLAVTQAIDGEPAEAGRVYVAAPDRHLTTRPGRLVFSDMPRVRFSRPSIDVLFASVAAAYGHRAVAVVLSGTGRDGAAGVRAIKESGGTTIVQDPRTAAHPGMPEAARATGCADYVVPLEAIGPALVALASATPPGGGI
jgi:two-component system chemotaxis response regulator CheB